MGDWYLTMFDNPVFQFVSGLVLGAVLVGAIWMLRFLYQQKKLMCILKVALLHIADEENMQKDSQELEKTAEMSEKSLEKYADLGEKSLEKVEEVEDGQD